MSSDWRMARMGSMRTARRAGTHAETSAVTSPTAAETTSAIGLSTSFICTGSV